MPYVILKGCELCVTDFEKEGDVMYMYHVGFAKMGKYTLPH